MLSPSANVLINRVDIYRETNAQDEDGGFTPTYSLSRSGVPCSVQTLTDTESTEEIVGDSVGHRVTEIHRYLVIFGANPGLKPRDRLIWRDGGATRTLFVQASENCAGRGSAWAIRAIERV